MQALLRTRFRARMGMGLHGGLMQAYLRRAQDLQRGWEERTGQSAVTGWSCASSERCGLKHRLACNNEHTPPQ